MSHLTCDARWISNFPNIYRQKIKATTFKGTNNFANCQIMGTLNLNFDSNLIAQTQLFPPFTFFLFVYPIITDHENNLILSFFILNYWSSFLFIKQVLKGEEL